jgi:hypothetical protein
MDRFLEECGVEMEPVKRARLGDCITDLLQKQAGLVVQKSDESWDMRVKTIMDTMDKKVDAKIQQSEQRTLELIKTLQEEVKAIKAAGSSASVSPSVATTTDRSGGTMGNYSNFVPTCVEIKGYISDWSQMDKTAMTKPEAMSFLSGVIEHIDPDVRKEIDMEKTEEKMRGVFISKIELQVNGGNAMCWKVKKELDKIMLERDMKVNDRRPSCVVQAAPWKKPCLNAAGKFLGYMKKMGIQKDKVIVDSWGPPKVRIAHAPGGAARPALLAEFTEKGGWSIQEGELIKLKSDLTAAAVLEAMRA